MPRSEHGLKDTASFRKYKSEIEKKNKFSAVHPLETPFAPGGAPLQTPLMNEKTD